MNTDAIIQYFGFNEHPFMTTPDPRFLYLSSQVKEALAKCGFMARDRIGPIYMYGPIGSGKTSLVRLEHAGGALMQYYESSRLQRNGNTHKVITFPSTTNVSYSCSTAS